MYPNEEAVIRSFGTRGVQVASVMIEDQEARHTIGNLMAERDACKRQLLAAAGIVREMAAGKPEAAGRAVEWCAMIERVIVLDD